MNDSLEISGTIFLNKKERRRSFVEYLGPKPNRVVNTAREQLMETMLGGTPPVITHIGWGSGLTPTEYDHPSAEWTDAMESPQLIKPVNVTRFRSQLHVRWSLGYDEANGFNPTEWALLMETESGEYTLFSRAILPSLTKNSEISYHGVWLIDLGGSYE